MSKKHCTFVNFQRSFIVKHDTLNNSLWLQKFINKLMTQGKKFIIDKYLEIAFIGLKFSFKKLPVGMLAEQIKKFRPVLSFVLKRMGRKYNPITIPINYRRQYILSLTYIVKYVKSMTNRMFTDRLKESLENIFGSVRNIITRNVASDVQHLSEARFYTHLR